ncbi:MAG: [FeFe] hydrogenase H-cluster radical SAM maturase HydE [Clostridia bacterium]|nr:[FeFe] hydrogenase H-cluster radical SAM maturase HydE [Clostridia bacterium]
MTEAVKKLIDTLHDAHTLTTEEYERLVVGYSTEAAAYAAQKADAMRRRVFGNTVFIRGLIEVSNLCRNDCYYCGIRCSNEKCDRYCLTAKQILECCEEGYQLGFRTFVLQGGEGCLAVDDVTSTVREIKRRYPDCAVTLSLGEYSFEEYRRMRESGADRYLLRHETADREHYERLHPSSMSFDNRMRCLHDLRVLGFQVGCGFMVGSPYQTPRHIATDLKFIEEFAPEMCGIGPFIPQKDTPLGDHPAGTADLTVYLLSLLRLMHPELLLPATTALGSIGSDGRERGIRAGANVIMPNLSPPSERQKYALYDNKLSSGDESAQAVAHLRLSMQTIGYEIVNARGDHPDAHIQN